MAIPIGLAVAAGASLVKAGVKTARGISQRRKAKKLEESAKERFGEEGPVSETPAAIRDATARAQTLASARRSPGQAQAELALGARTAGAIGQAGRAAPGASSLLATIASVQGQEQRSLTALQGQAAQFRATQESNVQRALSQEGQFQEQNFLRNIYQPYQTALGEISAMRGAGATNIHGGVSDALGSASAFTSGGGFSGGSGTPSVASSPPTFNTQGSVDRFNANTTKIDPNQANKNFVTGDLPVTGSPVGALTGGTGFNF